MSKAKEVSLWAAAAAFFGSLLAVGIFDAFNPDQWVESVGALLVAAITGGGVYAKERLGFAQKRPDNGPPPERQRAARKRPVSFTSKSGS